MTHSRPAKHRSPAPRGHLRRSGFTLVEVITCVSILAIISTVCSQIIFTATNAFTENALRAELHAQATTVMERLVRELQNIQRDTINTATVPNISAFTASNITWNTQYSPSGQISGAAPASLTSSFSPGNTGSLGPSVSVTLAYFDKDNATVAVGGNASLIRRIQITVTITNGSMSESLRTKVYLRSMLSGSGAA